MKATIKVTEGVRQKTIEIKLATGQTIIIGVKDDYDSIDVFADGNGNDLQLNPTASNCVRIKSINK